MSDRKKKRIGLMVAAIVIALHAIGLVIYFTMTDRPPDPRMVGHWYGFHEEPGYTYDYLDYRGPDGKFHIEFRFFEVDGPPAVASTAGSPPAGTLPELFRGTTSGEWHCDGTGYSTAEKDSGRTLSLSFGAKLKRWIRDREWPDDEITYDYQMVRISEDAVAYRNPDTSREFWNIRVPPGSSFPEHPLREEAAREHFRLPLQKKSPP